MSKTLETTKAGERTQETFNLPLLKLASLIESQQFARLESEGMTLSIHKANYSTKIVPGRKFTKIDIGSSGAYMVDNATGEIFGIKGYGVIHRGHRYGTLDTIGDYDWSGYHAVKRDLVAAAHSWEPVAAGYVDNTNDGHGSDEAWSQ